jgi:surfactin synthase thioesterase subunit
MTVSVGDRNSWVRVLNPSPHSELRLFCFPHAGGAASYYLPLARELAPNIEVAAIQYPGRQDRRMERARTDIAELADEIAAAIRPRVGRYAFFGHSMGAVLAFEVARRLELSPGSGPLRLFVSGRRAPATVRDEKCHLRDDEGLLRDIRELGGTDPRFLNDPELQAMILPPTRADYQAIETYVYTPGPPVSCPITVLVGDDDVKTTVAEAALWRDHSAARDCGMRVFAGDHFYLDRHRPEVVREIRRHLPVGGAAKIPCGWV